MAKVVKPLTNTEIQQVKPREKEFNLSDGDGLILRVKPRGSKLWLFNYYHPFTKKRKNLSLGAYPEVSLAHARQKRLQYRELLASDIDPKEHKDQASKASEREHLNTLKKVATDWFNVKKTKVTFDYGEDLWNSLENHIFPKLGNYPISKISAPSAIEVLNPIAAKGKLETVKRLCQRLNEIMTFAVNTGVIFSNPLSGINQAFESPKKKSMATIRPNELPDFMKRLNSASIKLVTRCLIEWQLHTMVRPSEAAGAKWSEIYFNNNKFFSPPSSYRNT